MNVEDLKLLFGTTMVDCLVTMYFTESIESLPVDGHEVIFQLRWGGNFHLGQFNKGVFYSNKKSYTGSYDVVRWKYTPEY